MRVLGTKDIYPFASTSYPTRGARRSDNLSKILCLSSEPAPGLRSVLSLQAFLVELRELLVAPLDHCSSVWVGLVHDRARPLRPVPEMAFLRTRTTWASSSSSRCAKRWFTAVAFGPTTLSYLSLPARLRRTRASIVAFPRALIDGAWGTVHDNYLGLGSGTVTLGRVGPYPPYSSGVSRSVRMSAGRTRFAAATSPR